MKILIAIVSVFLLYAFPAVRTVVFHPILTVYYGVTDLYKYIRFKRWNEADYGDVRSYVAQSSVSFGCGKTLSAVHVAHDLYTRYNNKMVWDSERKKYVRQKIHILSNVAFTDIPYEKLVDLRQFVQEVRDFYEYDSVNNTMTVTYVIVDEAGAQFNSRQFKNNFDALFIQTLLTSRHFKASIILTSQRQGMIDALMRQITNTVVACRKIWRLQLLYYYDGYDMENAQNPSLIEPYRRTCWFIRDRDFGHYNTFELVGNLQKSCETGDMLSEHEILELQCNAGANVDGVLRNSRKYVKNKRRMR